MTIELPAKPSVQTGSGTYSSAMLDARNYIAWIMGAFSRYLAAPVLEVGVGHASYAAELRHLGPYYGVDIDRESVLEARARLPDLKFEVADITRPDFPSSIAPMKPNSIVCCNVLEHIPEDRVAVVNLASALASGGHLLLIVPALPLLYNDLDRLAGHCRRYRRREVASLLSDAGLDVVQCDYINSIGGLGWLANRLVRHESLNAPAVNGQIALFDKWLIPISKLIDPLTRRFFGQSVLAVGAKR